MLFITSNFLNNFNLVLIKVCFVQRLGGNEDLGFNNAVFLSERECADRNYALGFYMREHKCFPENCKLKECMDFYFQVSKLGNSIQAIFK